jgi:uncharacterized repeat protein (TIGR01451 family)
MVGDTIRYTTTIENKGGSSAMFSSYSPVMPVGTTYKPGTLTVGGVAKTDAAGDDTAAWNSGPTSITAYIGTGATSSAGGTLASAATATVTFDVVVTSAANSGSLSFSTVTTFADPLAPTWPITAAPTTIGTAFTRGPDVVVAVGTTPSASTGASATWTFTVSNIGPGSATGVSVAVNLPAGLTVTSVQNTTAGAPANCPIAASVATCTIGTMTTPLTRTITVIGTVLSTYSSSSMAITATATTTTVDPITANNAATNTATVADATVPSTPGTPTATNITSTGVTLTWTGSTDNFAVTGYNVYRDGVLQTTVAAPTLTWTDSGLTADTTYLYTVRARDAAGNLSTVSGTRSVKTLVLPPNATSYYMVTSATSGRCMQGNAVTNNAVTLTTTCTSANTRDWRFVPTTGGYVKVNELSPTTLVWNNSSPNFRVVTSAVTTAQEWLLTQYGDSFQIQSRSAPTMCVERTGTATIGIAACVTIGTDTDQLWVFTER